MNKVFLDYYRCPERYADLQLLSGGAVGRHPGYFRFGGTCVRNVNGCGRRGQRQ